MNKKIFRVFISIFVVAMLALPMSAVYAKPVDKFVEVEGAFWPTEVPLIEIKDAGNSDNQIWEFFMPQMWVGGISGTGLLDVRYAVHNADDAENLWVNVLAEITLTGAVAGVPGTVTIKFSSVSTRGGHWRIISGTGELANVHGQGTVWVLNPENLVIGYEGVIHFNP